MTIIAKNKKLKSINNVFRSKQVLGKNHEFCFRLMYHDKVFCTT